MYVCDGLVNGFRGMNTTPMPTVKKYIGINLNKNILTYLWL